MRLRPLVLDRHASFGITSSIDDGKPGINALQSCPFALDVNHIGMHMLGAHDGITSRRAIKECDSATGVPSNAQHGTPVVTSLDRLKASH